MTYVHTADLSIMGVPGLKLESLELEMCCGCWRSFMQCNRGVLSGRVKSIG